MMEGNRQVDILARPIRYAFILGINPTKREILNVLKYCCETFGGAHNVIIPSDGQRFEDWWGIFLLACDPDVIMYRGKFDNIGAIKYQISQLGIQPFKVKSLSGEYPESTANFSPLSIEKIYRAKAAETAHSRQGKRLTVLTILRGGKNSTLFDYFNYGVLSRSSIKEYREYIQFVDPTKARNMPRDLPAETTYGAVEFTREYITYDQVEYFSLCYEDLISGPFVAVTGDKNSLQDCCLLWNLRALSSTSLYVQWVDKTDINRLFEQPTDFVSPQTVNLPSHAKLLTSVTLGLSTSKPAKELLSLVPDYTRKISDIGFSYKHPSEYDRGFAITRYYTQKESLLLLSENHIRIGRSQSPPYNYQDCLFKDQVVDLEIESQLREDKKGLRFSTRQRAEDVLSIRTQLTEVEVRISRPGVTVLLPWLLSAETVNIKPTSDWEIISNLFRRRGFIIEESPSGKHMQRAIELVGGVEELANLYRYKITRAMLNAFQIPHSGVAKSHEGLKREAYRRSYTVKDLKSEVLRSPIGVSTHRKNKIVAEVDQYISDWLENGVLVSGFRLDCPECGFEGWYPIEMVGEKYVCIRCGSVNRRPHESEIHYRLHESVYQAHRENMVVPVLTLAYLKTMIAQDCFIYAVPVNLEKDNPKSPEIDIIAIVDGAVILGECKKPNKLDNKVFQRYDQLSEKLMADGIMFSTINRENTCEKRDCKECSSEVIENWHSDETFTHGVTSNTGQWGTREKIRDFRQKQYPKGIIVYTLCAYLLGFED
jgi:hypothetical protein